MSQHQMRDVAWALALLLAHIGCQSEVRAPSSAPAPTKLRFRSVDGTLFTSGLAAELRIALGSPAFYDLGLSAVSGNGDGWSATARLTRDQVLAGSASLGVAALGDGTARVQRSGSNATTATGGKLDVTISRAKIEGLVDVDPPQQLNGQATGDISVTCWVPAQGQSRPTGGSEIGGDALVKDEDFRTDGCAPFKSVAGL